MRFKIEFDHNYEGLVLLATIFCKFLENKYNKGFPTLVKNERVLN